MTDVKEPQSPSDDSAGAMLHAERRRQNFSVGDVSRHLKLSIRQVEALERDEYQIFGGPVFVHGFVRNYAKLLGLDPSLLIAAADRKMAANRTAAAPQDHARPEAAIKRPAADSTKNSVVPLFLAAAVLIAGVAGWMLTREQEAVPDEEPASMVSRQQPADSVRSANEALLTEPGADVVEEVQGGAVAPDRSRVVSQAPQGVLQFGFRQESWVEVRDRYGDVIFAELAPQGVSRRVTGAPPLSVVIGNAAGVDLSFNDKPVDLAPHTRVDVARLSLE